MCVRAQGLNPDVFKVKRGAATSDLDVYNAQQLVVMKQAFEPIQAAAPAEQPTLTPKGGDTCACSSRQAASAARSSTRVLPHVRHTPTV